MTESEAFRQGVKDFKEGGAKTVKGVKSFWVKKLISLREWDRRYSQNSIYCNIGIEGMGKGKKVKIGFVVANIVPEDCELLADEELLQVDDYRKAHNIYPRPLKAIA